MRLPSPSWEGPGSRLPNVLSSLLRRGLASRVMDAMFSEILRRCPTQIPKDLDLQSGRMLRRPCPYGKCSREARRPRDPGGLGAPAGSA